MRTEEEILKDFEKIGYVIDNDEYHCYMEDKYKKRIGLSKRLKIVYCYKSVPTPCEIIYSGKLITTRYLNIDETRSLSIKEFELLHELFECWGWL